MGAICPKKNLSFLLSFSLCGWCFSVRAPVTYNCYFHSLVVALPCSLYLGVWNIQLSLCQGVLSLQLSLQFPVVFTSFHGSSLSKYKTLSDRMGLTVSLDIYSSLKTPVMVYFRKISVFIDMIMLAFLLVLLI